MADLCTYKIEDRVWDEFCETDDHIVPQTGDKRSHGIAFHGDGYVDLEREQGAHHKSRTMLEHYSPDSNSIRYAPGLISDNPKTSGHDFRTNNSDSIGSGFCSNDTVHDEKSTADHSHSYRYPLGETPQINNDLSFFDNFEDVDTMFRSCDSTFGLGASSEDDFGWFSLTDALEGPRDSPKSDFKFPCPESNANYSIDDPASTTPDRPKESSSPLGRDEFTSPLSIGNGPSSSDSTYEFTHEDEIDEYKRQSRKQNPSEREEQYFGNGSSFSYFSNLPSEVIQYPYEGASSPAFQYMDTGHQQQALDQDCYLSTCDTVDLDDISPEAVRFRQLQHVTEQSFQGGTVIHSFILGPSSIAVK